MAFNTSLEPTEILLGNPDTKSLPLISVNNSSSNSIAVPISIFKVSAVFSPIINLYFSLIYLIIFSSKSLPATLNDSLTTIPPKEITAISAVPPPTSTIILP